MNTDEFVQSVLDALNEVGASYMVVGSVALNFYCVPRSTQDADIVIESQMVELARTLSRRLRNLRLDPQLGFESVTATKKALLHTDENDFHIELFELSHDGHDQQRFSRRTKVAALGTTAWIATIEDLIVTKLRWSRDAGREKDISDVRNLIAVQNVFIDWPYVESWCDQHATREVLERLRAECAP